MKSDSALRAYGSQRLSDRRWAIVQKVQGDLQVSVAELSQHFGVSEVSIRRDLVYLERAGLLRRMHGGAEAVLRTGQTLPFDARLLQNSEVKSAIAQVAAKLIRAENVILLDAGTTILAVAHAIPTQLFENGALTVVTRSLAIASLMRNQRRVRLILLGGVYVHDFDNFVGPLVENGLQGMHVDTLFVGIDGVTASRGLTTDNVLEANLYPIMARSADRVVVVADSSKIGVDRLQVILSLDEIHTFVSDSGAPDDFVRTLRRRGIEVILATRP